MSQSYTLCLWCGCRIYVACHPKTRLTHSRVIEQRGDGCPVRRHSVGARLWLWEMLPDPAVTEPDVHYEPPEPSHPRWCR